jgi:hypothetical protein
LLLVSENKRLECLSINLNDSTERKNTNLLMGKPLEIN